MAWTARDQFSEINCDRMAKSGADQELESLVAKHSAYFHFDPSSGKVVCSINGHQFPPRLDAVSAFIK